MKNAVKNAFAVDMAINGSSNTVLHMLAIAKEGVNFELKDINAISKKFLILLKFLHLYLLFIWKISTKLVV